MKRKTLFIAWRFFTAITFVVLFAGCKKEKGTGNTEDTKTYKIYTPVYASKTSALAGINGNASQPITKAGKLYIKDNFIYLNDLNKGIHIINNSNPSNPVQVAFLSIPGNLDIAIKGNTLYADMYSDLLAIDITNPRQVRITKTLENFFTGRAYVNGHSSFMQDKVAVDWLERDTTVPVENYPTWGWLEGDVLTLSAAGIKSTGTAGSMAGMVLMNDYLYAITEPHSVGIVNINNAASPIVSNEFFAGYDLQTIFPFNGKLFLGSAVGMFMFDVSNPASPVPLGEFTHGRACDPVITDGHYAYVTLHSGDGCGGEANELHVVDVSNLPQSNLVKTYQLTKPTGLSQDGNLLFVCDDTEVKIYNAANPSSLQLLGRIRNSQPYDIITGNNKAIVVCGDGLYQYDYSNLNSIRRLSFMAAKK